MDGGRGWLWRRPRRPAPRKLTGRCLGRRSCRPRPLPPNPGRPPPSACLSRVYVSCFGFPATDRCSCWPAPPPSPSALSLLKEPPIKSRFFFGNRALLNDNSQPLLPFHNVGGLGEMKGLQVHAKTRPSKSCSDITFGYGKVSASLFLSKRAVSGRRMEMGYG